MASQVVNLFVGSVIVLLVVIEWRHRAKRDGRKQATGALIFAGIIFGVAYLASSYFDMIGLLAVLVLLMIVNIFLFYKRSRKEKIATRTALQRHHDYYVGLKRQGKLSPADRYSLALAMLREEAGEVDPLPEEE